VSTTPYDVGDRLTEAELPPESGNHREHSARGDGSGKAHHTRWTAEPSPTLGSDILSISPRVKCEQSAIPAPTGAANINQSERERGRPGRRPRISTRPLPGPSMKSRQWMITADHPSAASPPNEATMLARCPA
jgi:hypothetical protein